MVFKEGKMFFSSSGQRSVDFVTISIMYTSGQVNIFRLETIFKQKPDIRYTIFLCHDLLMTTCFAKKTASDNVLLGVCLFMILEQYVWGRTHRTSQNRSVTVVRKYFCPLQNNCKDSNNLNNGLEHW